MTMNLYGSCDDCVDGLCSMNCSSAVLVTAAEHIAHDMRMGRFPARSSPALFLSERPGDANSDALRASEQSK